MSFLLKLQTFSFFPLQLLYPVTFTRMDSVVARAINMQGDLVTQNSFLLKHVNEFSMNL